MQSERAESFLPKLETCRDFGDCTTVRLDILHAFDVSISLGVSFFHSFYLWLTWRYLYMKSFPYFKHFVNDKHNSY